MQFSVKIGVYKLHQWCSFRIANIGLIFILFDTTVIHRIVLEFHRLTRRRSRGVFLNAILKDAI